LAKTSKRFYSIFTGCYYHSAKIEDIDHWMKFLMTGYIPPALPRYSIYIYQVEVKEGRLTGVDYSYDDLKSIPDSIRKLVDLTYLYFDMIQVFRGK
jgi:hypothetical protein